MNAKLWNDITSFRQSEDETLYEAWERFKELIRKCLMHGFQHWTQMEMFYNGLNAYTRMVVDASANDTLLDKSYNEAYEILERIANNDYQYPTIRVEADRRVAGDIELDAITSLTAQVSSLTNMIKTMKRPPAV
ncbi:Retrotransposon gag protein [Gossypium australe]|uniref:Retrotransposon gag protein n=1 Tax=Gossypium australe TaxID=47621 RepID=A0A5B6VDK7_9ROSI|nr:Retrotransposon gag protein [Gossypium australe]